MFRGFPAYALSLIHSGGMKSKHAETYSVPAPMCISERRYDCDYADDAPEPDYGHLFVKEGPSMSNPLPGPAARAAADWWAQFLSAPGPGQPDPTRDVPGLTGALIQSACSHTRYTPAQVRAFAAELAAIFQAQLDAGGRASAWTEYGPDEVLTYAARLAGFELDPLALPAKSFTLLQAGSGLVVTRLGPGGTPQILVPHVEAAS